MCSDFLKHEDGRCTEDTMTNSAHSPPKYLDKDKVKWGEMFWMTWR